MLAINEKENLFRHLSTVQPYNLWSFKNINYTLRTKYSPLHKVSLDKIKMKRVSPTGDRFIRNLHENFQQSISENAWSANILQEHTWNLYFKS
jgi:hypothetical protein